MDPEKLEDKILICINCREEFAFTVSAQEYFREKGYNDDPRRCRSCHKEHKQQQRQNALSNDAQN